MYAWCLPTDSTEDPEILVGPASCAKQVGGRVDLRLDVLISFAGFISIWMDASPPPAVD
jgi:hypothetical protein